MANEQETAKILKEAIIIVDKLAKMDADDDAEALEELIEKAKKLTKNKLWKL
jgi:archaellum biogenesis ATPase FlaH